MIDELDLSGISLYITARADEAAFGANFVVIASEDAAGLRLGHLAKGAVVVNSSGADLPDTVTAAATKIYVDSMHLIEDNPHRRLVQIHTAHYTRGAAGHRAKHRFPPITGDLSGLLNGNHAARTEPGAIVLVEMLSAAALSCSLGHQLTQAAQWLGLGTAISQPAISQRRQQTISQPAIRKDAA